MNAMSISLPSLDIASLAQYFLVARLSYDIGEIPMSMTTGGKTSLSVPLGTT